MSDPALRLLVAARHLIARARFEASKARHDSLLVRMREIEDEIGTRLDELFALQDTAEREQALMLAAAEVVLSTRDEAERDLLAEQARIDVEAFVAERRAARRAA